MRYKRDLHTEKRNHFFDSGDPWGYEWLENRDKSSHKLLFESDIQVIIYNPFVFNVGLVFLDKFQAEIGLGLAF